MFPQDPISHCRPVEKNEVTQRNASKGCKFQSSVMFHFKSDIYIPCTLLLHFENSLKQISAFPHVAMRLHRSPTLANSTTKSTEKAREHYAREERGTQKLCIL